MACSLAQIASHKQIKDQRRAPAAYQTRQDFSGYRGLPLVH
jgi:hypothetical protein